MQKKGIVDDVRGPSMGLWQKEQRLFTQMKILLYVEWAGGEHVHVIMTRILLCSSNLVLSFSFSSHRAKAETKKIYVCCELRFVELTISFSISSDPL